MENPNLNWIIIWGYPYFRKPPYVLIQSPKHLQSRHSQALLMGLEISEETPISFMVFYPWLGWLGWDVPLGPPNRSLQQWTYRPGILPLAPMTIRKNLTTELFGWTLWSPWSARTAPAPKKRPHSYRENPKKIGGVVGVYDGFNGKIIEVKMAILPAIVD
jgi:hypothetical protein